MSTEPNKYTLLAELKGSQGAVNALIFSKDAKILISGGDDGCVRVWNTETFKCEQVLYNSKWGQITVLSWILVDPPPVEKNSTSICVGTGRGSLYLCPMATGSTWFSMKQANDLSVFEFNDAIEAHTYDPLNQRLAVASHSGKIKMYLVENCLVLTELWSANLPNAIPRSLRFFGGANQSLLIHGLETGEMSCRDAQSSNIMWSKILAGGIGNATLSPDETLLLVDNLTTGTFDLYRFPASTPFISFSLLSIRRFIKQCIFAEGAKVAVCGSDNGRVQVVDLLTGESIQSLGTDQEHGMIQTVAAATVNENTYLIAGGSTNASPAICIWHKKLSSGTAVLAMGETNAVHPAIKLQQKFTKQTFVNCAFALLIVLISYPNWSPYFWQVTSFISVTLAHSAYHVAKFSAPDVDTGIAMDTLVTVKAEVGQVMREGRNSLTNIAIDAGALGGVVVSPRAASVSENIIFL